MAVSLVVLTQPGDARTRRELSVAAGTSILKAAHEGGVDITATCGGRGRCTSCRVKFVAGTIPPPTIMDEIQLGDDLVREGYRLSCQCTVTEPITVQVAPPLEERAFQILGAGPGVGGLGVRIDAGIAKELVKVSLPREEHHQTSDLEQLAAAVGVAPESVGPSVLVGLPQALRDDPAGVTVTTFTSGSTSGGAAAGAGRTVVAVERGDTTAMKFGLAIDVGTTSVVTTLIELESGEQLSSRASSAPTPSRSRSPRGWPTRPRCAWPSTSAPTARSCSARASACSPARPRRAPRWRARRSATVCAARRAPSTG